jgi:acylpyruvate hydrolase
MRFASFQTDGGCGLAIDTGDGQFFGLVKGEAGYPGGIIDLLRGGDGALQRAGLRLAKGRCIDLSREALLPPISNPEKIICIGLNYADHSAESGFKVPDYPAIFDRFSSSLVGHNAPLVRPKVSSQFDYEGELVVVIGRGGRHIPKSSALNHVAGYSIFNDGSVRDYQFKSTQWSIGKNFDGTGAFGPTFVTADELPEGCKGLLLQTRLNGAIVQSASTSDMLFDVASLITIISEAITLAPGDIIVTGTPSGVGLARKPPLFMKAGDVCEVEIEQLGTLRNCVVDEN